MATAAAPHAPAERHPLLAFVAIAWSWLFLLLLVLFFEFWARLQYGSTFVLNPYNLQSIALAASMPLLLALGQTLVIIAGGIDLSVGFVMGLASVVMATVMQAASGLHPGLSLLLGIVAALLVSVVPGFISGTLIARLAIPAFIGTLGMYGVCRGVGFLTASGTTVPVNNPWLFQLGNAKILQVPVPVILTAIVVLVMHWVLREGRFGRYTYAIGGSKAAAVRAGINVPRHTVLLYMLSAFCAGIAGVVYTARFSAGAAQGGEPLLLDSIAAVVIGGASLFGGSGTIVGTVIGAFIIAVIQYGLVFINV
ncbi:ABC transporter permease subunit, partial [Geminicoccus flavidas]|uniref:ABC transporter permease subunit n=1 Tax=Geminicoccus flavidas TaxID=2506407 RepID=UPI00190F09B5